MKRTALLFSLAATFLVASSPAQEPAKTLQEKLGYPRDAKLLIVHADDLA